MANFIGLYYPFIHFKNEGWLKTVALYMDQVNRIVPKEYPLRDSEVVRKLAGETGVINNVPPSPNEEWPVRDSFVQFITSNAPQLESRYGLAHRNKWRNDPITSKWAPNVADKRLGYVHLDKIWPQLKDTLIDTGLAELARGQDEQWVGMHPKLADVYVTVLAEHMTSSRGWYPVTDETLDQLAVSGFSVGRLSRALLDDENLVGDTPTADEKMAALANLCLKTVIPKNATAIPVATIIKLRKENRTEFAAFQHYLASFRVEATRHLRKLTDRAALNEHLSLEYSKTMQPSIEEVRRAFKLMKVETATSIVNINYALPSAVSGALAAHSMAANPIFGAVAGFALGVIPIIQKRRDDAQAALKKPGAWLLRLDEALKPKDFISRVHERARKFALGV